MASALYGVNATKRDVSNPSVKIDPGEVNGRVRFAYDSYTAAGAITINSTINFMQLPKGARVLSAQVVADDLGTAGAAKLGWLAGATGAQAADDDALVASIDLATAAAKTEMNLEAGKFAKLVETVTVQMTITTATTVAGSIKVGVWYVVD